MCIDVNPLALGLFEKLLEVFEIMARNENSLALPMTKRDLGRHRVSVSSGIAGIKEFHCPKIDLAALEHKPYPVVEAEVSVERGSKCLMDVCIDLIILLT